MKKVYSGEGMSANTWFRHGLRIVDVEYQPCTELSQQLYTAYCSEDEIVER